MGPVPEGEGLPLLDPLEGRGAGETLFPIREVGERGLEDDLVRSWEEKRGLLDGDREAVDRQRDREGRDQNGL